MNRSGGNRDAKLIDGKLPGVRLVAINLSGLLYRVNQIGIGQKKLAYRNRASHCDRVFCPANDLSLVYVYLLNTLSLHKCVCVCGMCVTYKIDYYSLKIR